MDRMTAFGRFRRHLHDQVPGVTTAAYDRRGYASSVHLQPVDSLPLAETGASRVGLPASPAFEQHVADLQAVIAVARAESGSVGPLIIVGHSLGGTVTLGYAARTDPGHTGLAGIVCGEPPFSWMPWWPHRAGGSTLAAGAEGGPAAAAESFMRRIVGDRIWERLPKDTKDARRAEGSALVSDLTAIRTGGIPVDLSAVGVPTVFFRGTKSSFHAKRGAEYGAATVPVAQLRVLHGASHAVHSERPLDHVEAVLALLGGSLPAKKPGNR
jgi:pimeloyl-ACP methyl ester carboxylesterase